MITQYGMSERFGLIGLESVQSRYLDGRAVMNCGEATAAEIDAEVMEMLKVHMKRQNACFGKTEKHWIRFQNS